jgi:hypothetical protein
MPSIALKNEGSLIPPERDFAKADNFLSLILGNFIKAFPQSAEGDQPFADTEAHFLKFIGSSRIDKEGLLVF